MHHVSEVFVSLLLRTQNIFPEEKIILNSAGTSAPKELTNCVTGVFPLDNQYGFSLKEETTL